MHQSIKQTNLDVNNACEMCLRIVPISNIHVHTNEHY